MLELGLVAALGFLGSFGHCVGMCGPIAIAFSLASQSDAGQENTQPSRVQQFIFHLLLNLGRLTSYVLVGAAIGGLGSVLVAGGQVAGVGSVLRRSIALLTGGLLILMGLRQVAPGLLPKLPFLHPLQGALHQRLQQAMDKTSQVQRWWTPMLIGLAWGLVPCGFLYTAQVKAASASTPLGGATTLLAFGLGTLPTMVGLGTYSAWISGDRKSQLFQLGGWITLLIGVLTLMRTGDLMVDYSGHLSLVCLGLALVARPLSKVWAYPLKCRRLLGISAFVLALAHTMHMLEHSWNWNFAAVNFMLPQHQWGVYAGIVGLLLMIPLTFTSTDFAQRKLGKSWRSLHLLSIPILILCVIHCILAGSTYLGSLQWQGRPLIYSLCLSGAMMLVFAMRAPFLWEFLNLEQFYMPVKRHPAAAPQPSQESR